MAVLGTSQRRQGGLSPGLWSLGARPRPAAVIRDIEVTVDHELDLVKYFAGSTRLKLFSLSRVYWEAAAFQGRSPFRRECEQEGPWT